MCDFITPPLEHFGSGPEKPSGLSKAAIGPKFPVPGWRPPTRARPR